MTKKLSSLLIAITLFIGSLQGKNQPMSSCRYAYHVIAGYKDRIKGRVWELPKAKLQDRCQPLKAWSKDMRERLQSSEGRAGLWDQLRGRFFYSFLRLHNIFNYEKGFEDPQWWKKDIAFKKVKKDLEEGRIPSSQDLNELKMCPKTHATIIFNALDKKDEELLKYTITKLAPSTKSLNKVRSKIVQVPSLEQIKSFNSEEFKEYNKQMEEQFNAKYDLIKPYLPPIRLGAQKNASYQSFNEKLILLMLKFNKNPNLLDYLIRDLNPNTTCLEKVRGKIMQLEQPERDKQYKLLEPYLPADIKIQEAGENKDISQ